MSEIMLDNNIRAIAIALRGGRTSARTLAEQAVTLPVGLDAAGMPVGLQLIGIRGTQERLLSAALAVEATLGTGAHLSFASDTVAG